MKAADRKELANYVRSIADQMGLRDWTFIISRDDPEAEDAGASIKPTYARRQATICFCPQLRDIHREEVRQIVVHELVHCHAAPVDQHLEHQLKAVMGEREHKAWYSVMDWLLEQMVDDIAAAIAPCVPLINWPKPAKKKGK